MDLRKLVSGLKGDGVGSRLSRGLVGSGLVWGLRLVAALGVTTVLGRMLGASGYGAYAYSLAWIASLSTLANLGCGVLATRELGAGRPQAEFGGAGPMIGYLSQLVWISSAIVVLLFLLGSIAYNLLYDRAFELTIILEAIAIPLMAQVRQSQGVLRGLGKPSLGQFLLLVAIPGVNLAVFVAVLSITGPTTLLAVSTYVVAVLAVFVAARLVTRKGLAPLKADVSGERKRYWRKSSGILGLGVVAFVLSDQLPALLTGILGSDAEVGLLDMARKFGMLTSVGLSVVSLPLGPILAELHARDDMVKFQSIAAKSTALAVVWSILLTAVFALAGPLVLRAINPDFAIAYTALLVISAGQVFSTAAGPVGMVLNMTGHERDSLRGVMSSLTTIIVLVVVLVPTMGHLGAAIGACAGAIVWNFVLTYYVRKRLGIAVHAFAAWERR